MENFHLRRRPFLNSNAYLAEVKDTCFTHSQNSFAAICLQNREWNYIIQYVDEPAKVIQLFSAEKLLSLADDAFLKANRSSLISKRPLTLRGYIGHEVVIKRYDGRKEFEHSYLIGDRRYSLLTVQSHMQTVADPTASDKFLNSFTLLQADNNETMTPYDKATMKRQ